MNTKIHRTPNSLKYFGIEGPHYLNVLKLNFVYLNSAMAVFTKLEHAQERVKRCENHKKAKDVDLNIEYSEQTASHFLRCCHDKAWYEENMFNSQESVVIPFEKPASI